MKGNAKEQSLTRASPYVLARILSNDLSPLHGVNQTYFNTKLILEEEVIPEDFTRLWVVSSILDEHSKNLILQLLRRHHQWVKVIPVPKVSNFTQLKSSVLNPNRARNLALKSGLDAGAKWVFLFDGGSILTSEAIKSLAGIGNRTRDPLIFAFIPTVRLLYKVEITSSRTYQELFPFISGLQECHLGVSRKFLEKRSQLRFLNTSNSFLFEESRLYGSADKYDMLKKIRRLSDKFLHCKMALNGQKQPVTSRYLKSSRKQ